MAVRTGVSVLFFVVIPRSTVCSRTSNTCRSRSTHPRRNTVSTFIAELIIPVSSVVSRIWHVHWRVGIRVIMLLLFGTGIWEWVDVMTGRGARTGTGTGT
jgi:hypothetical protein